MKYKMIMTSNRDYRVEGYGFEDPSAPLLIKVYCQRCNREIAERTYSQAFIKQVETLSAPEIMEHAEEQARRDAMADAQLWQQHRCLEQ